MCLAEVSEEEQRRIWHKDGFTEGEQKGRSEKAMEAAGFISTHPHNKTFYHGIRLLTSAENDFAVPEDDFLN